MQGIGFLPCLKEYFAEALAFHSTTILLSNGSIRLILGYWSKAPCIL